METEEENWLDKLKYYKILTEYKNISVRAQTYEVYAVLRGAERKFFLDYIGFDRYKFIKYLHDNLKKASGGSSILRDLKLKDLVNE